MTAQDLRRIELEIEYENIPSTDAGQMHTDADPPQPAPRFIIQTDLEESVVSNHSQPLEDEEEEDEPATITIAIQEDDQGQTQCTIEEEKTRARAVQQKEGGASGDWRRTRAQPEGK